MAKQPTFVLKRLYTPPALRSLVGGGRKTLEEEEE